jgi:hypothetical protein
MEKKKKKKNIIEANSAKKNRSSGLKSRSASQNIPLPKIHYWLHSISQLHKDPEIKFHTNSYRTLIPQAIPSSETLRCMTNNMKG